MVTGLRWLLYDYVQEGLTEKFSAIPLFSIVFGRITEDFSVMKDCNRLQSGSESF